MARGINKTISIGNLCEDPNTRYMPSGGAVTNIRIAMGDSYKDKNTGQQVDKTEFMTVVFFNRLAEIAGEYLRKGSKVYVEGSLRTRKYQAQDGSDRYVTEIVGNELQMLDSRTDAAGGNVESRSSANPAGGQGAAVPPQQPAEMDSFDDSIPF